MKLEVASLLSVIILLTSCNTEGNKEKNLPKHKIPHLAKQGTATQLIVDDEPFIILGGELGNSTFTSSEAMEDVWSVLDDMNLNTVLAPVYWEIIEPVEGEFDFSLYDELIEEARDEDLRLVLLWFGSWKNSMSSHAPGWVKKNQKRFPRAKDKEGNSQEILTPLSEENMKADRKAYKALLNHIKEIDSMEQTVIMMQPENEIGMLPSARDYSKLANEKFNAQVPEELISYLVQHKETLVPEFKAIWEVNGYKETGTWEEVFGKGLHTDEIFMAWYYAKYTDQITEAGKAIYPLPAFVNAALNRPGWKPGEYPSAGPLPHLMDIWKAAGPSIDFLAPDFYNPRFEHWCDLYTRQDNPLFVPEHQFDSSVAAKAAFAIGHYEGLGFSPFSIENPLDDPEETSLSKMYDLIDELMPVITANQGAGKVDGVFLAEETDEQIVTLGDYQLSVKQSHALGWTNIPTGELEPAGAIIVHTDTNEFYLAGTGVVITFTNLKNPALNVGILKAEEGDFDGDEWEVYRHLNGDQTHQGRHIRIFPGEYMIQRFELYNYE